MRKYNYTNILQVPFHVIFIYFLCPNFVHHYLLSFFFLFLTFLFYFFTPGDLWGPLLVCLLLSSILSATAPGDSASLVFAAVFVIVWCGAAAVTINAQLLGGTISFFQSVCILGYCVFPLTISSIICLLLSFVYKQVCMCVCMYVCMHVCVYVCMHVCMYVCMYVFTYVCRYVCIYATLYLSKCLLIFILIICFYCCYHHY